VSGADVLLEERRGAIAILTMNRPEKRNALSVELRYALAGAFRALAEDQSVAALVLTGAPPAFSAGMDRTEFGGDDEHRRHLFESSRAVFETLMRFPLPALAAVNGHALGGGFGLAACCDVRLASPSAQLGLPEIALGIPSSFGAALLAAPAQTARELVFTGRVLSAAEALELGIVRAVADDVLGAAVALAQQMVRHGRAVLEGTKRMIVESMLGGEAVRAWDAEMRRFHEVLFGKP
jgi:enoyl-CoA hydratase/carnithine racemase